MGGVGRLRGVLREIEKSVAMELVEEGDGRFHLSDDKSMRESSGCLALLVFIPVFLAGLVAVGMGLDSPGGEVFILGGALLTSVGVWAIFRALKVLWAPRSWARIRFDVITGQIVHELFTGEQLVEERNYPFTEDSRIEISVRKHRPLRGVKYVTYETALKNPSTPRLKLWPKARSRKEAEEFVDRIYERFKLVTRPTDLD